MAFEYFHRQDTGAVLNIIPTDLYAFYFLLNLINAIIPTFTKQLENPKDEVSVNAQLLERGFVYNSAGIYTFYPWLAGYAKDRDYYQRWNEQNRRTEMFMPALVEKSIGMQQGVDVEVGLKPEAKERVS